MTKGVLMVPLWTAGYK